MKRNEVDYLTTLKKFSAPTREFWASTYIDDRDVSLTFEGEAAMYRYWDATHCVEFSYRMAEQALDEDLRGETAFLMNYDHVVKSVEAHYDIRNNDLTTIVLRALKSGGTVSKHSRKQFGDVVSAEALEFIEKRAQEVVAEVGRRSNSPRTRGSKP
jgi:hypothetical protein